MGMGLIFHQAKPR